MNISYLAYKIRIKIMKFRRKEFSWYEISEIQVKIKCGLWVKFCVSFSFVLSMPLINITSLISITHFLFQNQRSVAVSFRLAVLLLNAITAPTRVSSITSCTVFFCFCFCFCFFWFFSHNNWFHFLVPEVILLLLRLCLPSGHWMSVADFLF
jgi:hypothetical protein